MMASSRIHQTLRLLSRLSVSTKSSSRMAGESSPKALISTFRFFTTNKDDDEDPFGLHFDSGENNLGAELPPSYIRDKATGKFTSEIAAELSPRDQRLLKMDEDDKDRLLLKRLVEKYEDDDDGESLLEVGDKIAAEEMALNTIGRHAKVDGKFSEPLSSDEFKSFTRFMSKTHQTLIKKSDIANFDGESETFDSENPDLDLKWMSAAARREVEGHNYVDPIADIVPHDMNPTRLVNRKKAKLLPKMLIHHNNLALLRRYCTPTGQIMNRSQSRLGAKDQRKVAKLVKRARAMGLIPYFGQWSYENHGNRFEADINEDREWEKELIRRGLVNRD